MQGKNVTACKLRREASEETKPTGILILNFQTPEW